MNPAAPRSNPLSSYRRTDACERCCAPLGGPNAKSSAAMFAMLCSSCGSGPRPMYLSLNGLATDLDCRSTDPADTPDSTRSPRASSTSTPTTEMRSLPVPDGCSPVPRTRPSPTWPRCPAAVSVLATPRPSWPRSSTSCAASSRTRPWTPAFRPPIA